MKCNSCGGSLPPKSDICRYCGSLNDTDLRGLHFNTTNETETNRVCPRCETKLQTINLGIDGKFYIERCSRCLGIFFDPGELERVIETSVTNVIDVDHHKLNALIDERQKSNHPVSYIKCPVCRNLMNRKRYGSRSGVISDVCKEHGVWLDGGELGTLLRWSKAGGQIHAGNRTEERKRVQMKEEQAKRRNKDPLYSGTRSDEDLLFSLLSLVGHNK